MDLRRRIPFLLRNEDEETGETSVFLDDQEQEEVIENLRIENARFNKKSISMMEIVVLISAILHVVYFVDPTDDPLLILLPRENSNESIPLPRPFTFVSLVLHANLMLLLDSTRVRNVLLQVRIGIDDNNDLGNYTLPPTLAYTLAFVAPAVCLFLRRSWSTIAWWSITVLLTYTVQLVLEAAATGSEHIRSLEAMRYAAPGA
ncbi:hypothetical protein J3R30DRAFT_3456389 [Lentinula aciculospora]|uniref:Transmembrane protein n=1 Tax=Lentinula aciculospora TaxID=153920 RepID=A0A9W9AGN4_9AGAR|nr:hypothetical protein J3R30DRAFT_3456389 [Lentinula aciculospora]